MCVCVRVCVRVRVCVFVSTPTCNQLKSVKVEGSCPTKLLPPKVLCTSDGHQVLSHGHVDTHTGVVEWV